MKSNPKSKKLIAPIFFLLALLVLSEFLPLWLNIPNYVFPRPSEIFAALLFVKEILWLHLITTLGESVVGFLVGSIIGFLLGMLMAEYKLISNTLLPYVIGSNAVPVIAVAPIFILWFKHGMASKIAVSAFLCFFPLCINTFKGLTEYNPILFDLFAIHGSTRFQFLSKCKIPNALPFIFAGLKLNATYAVIGAIVGEFIGANSGLGFGMLQASYNLNVPRLWGYILVSAILGVLMYASVWAFEQYGLRKRSANMNKQQI